MTEAGAAAGADDGMFDGRRLIDAVAPRMEELITAAPDPRAAMEEIAEQAERSRLAEASWLRTDDEPWVFVMDLLIDNPWALDWMALHGHRMMPPESIEDVADLLDRFPALK